MRQGAVAAGQGVAAGPAWALHVRRHVDCSTTLAAYLPVLAARLQLAVRLGGRERDSCNHLASWPGSDPSAASNITKQEVRATVPPGVLQVCASLHVQPRRRAGRAPQQREHVGGHPVPCGALLQVRWADALQHRVCTCQGPVSWHRMEWLQAVLVACTLAKVSLWLGALLLLVTAPCSATLSCWLCAGSAAVRLFLDTRNVRAWPGGPGEHKIGGNYAPTVMPQMAAMAQHKCSQVGSSWLGYGCAAAIGGAAGQWLPTAAGERACRCCRGFNTMCAEHSVALPSRCWQVMYALPRSSDPLDATIGECGAMNLFFVFDKTSSSSGSGSGDRQLEVVTPPLDGTILPGVTRDSILQLLRK